MHTQNMQIASSISPHRIAVPESAPAASLLAAGTRALWTDGDLRNSQGWFDAAYRTAELDNDGPSMAWAALGLAGLWVHQHRGAVTAAIVHDRMQQALTVVAPDSSLALRLRARLAAEADYRIAEHSHILTVVDEARRAGDRVATAEAISLAHHCLLGPDHTRIRRELAQDLIAASSRTSRRSDMLMGVLWHTVDLVLEADSHAERNLTELRALLADENNLAVSYVLEAIDVMLDIRAGRFDQAEIRARHCRDQGHAVGDADAISWYGAHLVSIRWFQGRIAELLPMLGDLAISPSLSTVDYSFTAALAVATATAGDHRQARTVLARLAGRDLATIPRSSSWLVAMYGVVETAWLVGDTVAAAQAYDLLSPFAPLPIIASLGVACFGSVQHALGLASLTSGDPQTAVGHLREAVRQNRAMGNWPAAALSRHRLACALSQSPHGTDNLEAPQEFEAARRDACELNMQLPHDQTRTHQPDASNGNGDGAKCLSYDRLGSHWRIEFGTRSALVRHCRGMGYLAVLIANPGQEIMAGELAMRPGLTADTLPKAPSTNQLVLDTQAIKQYRQRLAVLQSEIDHCDATGDQERAIRAETERDWLLAELRAATGLAGGVRPFATTDERARIAVGKAIRRALEWITAVDPVIGAGLASHVSTGHRCCYGPPP